MKKILILTGRYLPGHKDGGPLRTLINLTDALCDEYEFYIACYDRDHGDSEAYVGITYNAWNKVGNTNVWYVSENKFSKKLIQELSHEMDFIYLTSFYEEYGYKTLLLKKEKKIRCPVFVASMGVFAKEALAHNAIKKKIFISGCKLFGLLSNITWSVTSEIEATDVKRIIGMNIKYVVAEDLPRMNVLGRRRHHDEKLRIVFLSRICEHKNPGIVIDAIEKMRNKDEIDLAIYGPIQEIEYWNECLKKLDEVHYQWRYGGDVPSERVLEVLSESDVFVLPSKSENYGHVVFEALSVGCIPVISDRTPWKDLNEEQIGFEIPLNVDEFSKCLDELSEMTATQRDCMSEKCVAYAKRKIIESTSNTGYRKLFS